jgi:hypothetical protein
MARGTRRLTDVTIKRAKPVDHKPLLLHDGAGLYLQVVKVGSGGDAHLNRTWVYRYESAGQAHRMGLGTYPTISLGAARDLADEARRVRQAGKDPILERRQHKAEQQRTALRARKMITFEEAAAQYIAANKAAWRSPRHEDDWTRSLQRYAHPRLRQVAVDEIDAANVLEVLQPIWSTKTVTAVRLRGRLEKILNWAAVHGEDIKPRCVGRQPRARPTPAWQGPSAQEPAGNGLRRCCELHGKAAGIRANSTSSDPRGDLRHRIRRSDGLPHQRGPACPMA